MKLTPRVVAGVLLFTSGFYVVHGLVTHDLFSLFIALIFLFSAYLWWRPA